MEDIVHAAHGRQALARLCQIGRHRGRAVVTGKDRHGPAMDGNRHLRAFNQQLFNQVAADEAGAAGDEHARVPVETARLP